jgi:hypothetical protein
MIQPQKALHIPPNIHHIQPTTIRRREGVAGEYLRRVYLHRMRTTISLQSSKPKFQILEREGERGRKGQGKGKRVYTNEGTL